MQDSGSDDTFTDVCDKRSVLIRNAGYEDTTLHLGSELVDGNGRMLIVTKYDSDGIKVKYVDTADNEA